MGYDRGDSFPFGFLDQMKVHLVQNRKKTCHHDHIPFNVKGNGNIVFSVYLDLFLIEEAAMPAVVSFLLLLKRKTPEKKKNKK